MSKPILCVDFDGVIHSYASGWKGETIIPDPPVTGALAWLFEASKIWDVQIYSSRSKSPHAVNAMQLWMRAYAELEFGEEHPMAHGDGEYPIKFAHEKPAAFLTIDDRAICFEGVWAELDPKALLDFKPWNKRPLGASGAYPHGKMNADDEGELKIGITFDPKTNIVIVDFGKRAAWIGFDRNSAIEFAKVLMEKAGAKNITVEL